MVMEERVAGRSVSGDPRVHSGIGVTTKPGTASYIVMLDSAGNERFLWFDTTGDLRTGTTQPTAPQTDGSVVGTQS